MGSMRALAPSFLALIAAATLAGCSESLPSLPKLGDLNPWAEKPRPLPGKRVAITDAGEKLPGELAAADRPLTLPAPRSNETWSQPGGPPNNAPGNLMLAAAVKHAWSADAGTGSNSKGRLTASPIVYDGRIYTIDSTARVNA